MIRFTPLSATGPKQAAVLLLAVLLMLYGSVPRFAAASGNQLPSLGDASSSLVSPEMERRIGEAFLKQLHASVPISDDLLLQAFVEKEMSALMQHSELTDGLQSVLVVNRPDINAFAAPGGIIGINSGLFIYAQDFEEYSSVVAHEMAHISQRHFARGLAAQKAATLPTLVGMVAAILVGAAGGSDAALAAMSTAQAAGQSKRLRFSREREQEADRIGINTMQRAGLNPDAMARMFERMQRAYRFSSRLPEFLLTHPISESRITDARDQARDGFAVSRAVAKPPEPQNSLYRMMQARVQLHFENSPVNGIRLYQKRYDDNPKDWVTGYGLAKAFSLGGQHEQAVELVRSIVNDIPSPIFATLALAEILIDAELYVEANELLTEQLLINPDNHPLDRMLARGLTAQNQHAEAVIIFAKQSKLRPLDTVVWFNLAEIAGLAGDITQVHLARAEYFYLHGALQRAIQHLEYAQRLARGKNQQLVAKLGQRIQDLRTAIRMQKS